MQIRFLGIAEIELDEAIQYYNHDLPLCRAALFGMIHLVFPRSVHQRPPRWVSPCDGEVEDVLGVPGQAVEADEVLVRFRGVMNPASVPVRQRAA